MHSSEMYLTFLQSVRDMANRYVAVSMQEHALTEIVLSGTEKAQKLLETKDESADSQAQSIVMATAFRSNRDDLAISDDSDAALILTPAVFCLIIYTNFFRKTKAEVAISQLSAQNLILYSGYILSKGLNL